MYVWADAGAIHPVRFRPTHYIFVIRKLSEGFCCLRSIIRNEQEFNPAETRP